MSFVKECVRDSLPLWEACLNSAFLTQLERGSLPEDCFKGYIVEDSLYLREYAKVFGWAMTRAKTMEDIRICYALLSFVNEGENATRLQYLRRYGLEDAQIQHLPQRPANRAYTEYMLKAAMEGDMAECMMACLPCMISYGWIFQALWRRSPQVRESVYWPFVKDYTQQAYMDSCGRWAAYTDALMEALPAQRKEKCLQIFRQCSRYELDFWNMCLLPRTDV